MNSIFCANSIVWPLTFLLVFLLMLWRVQTEVKPIVTSMVSGLAVGAQRNATQWGIAIMFGLSASMAAFYDVFIDLSSKEISALSYHQYAAYWTKVLNPFIVAVLAYVTQSNFKPGNGGSTGTNAPFAQKAPPASPATPSA